MKALGFSAIAATVISFILWFINWAYWFYQSNFTTYDSATYESQKMIRYVMQGISFFSAITEYLAILLIAVCVITIIKRLPQR